MSQKQKSKKSVRPKKFTCKRCGHIWESRPGRLELAGRNKPVACPACISRSWDKQPSKGASKVKARTARTKAGVPPIEKAA